MTIRFSLTIDGAPVDLFNDESVELTRQLKDLMNLSTIWTDYTKDFQIPASDTNNEIFANWFDEKNVADKLSEDLMVRSYIKSSKRKAGVARIVIERTAKQLRITLHTSRPGVIIGKSGKDITLLEEELKQISKKDVKILIHEIKRPEVDAQLVAENIAQQLEGRVSFRKAMKQSVGAAMRMGAEGIRVMCSVAF